MNQKNTKKVLVNGNKKKLKTKKMRKKDENIKKKGDGNGG